MWNRTAFNSICTQTRRVVEPHHSLCLRFHYLLHWNSVETLFRKLSWPPNLPRYRTGCFRNPRSYILIRKPRSNINFIYLWICDFDSVTKKMVSLLGNADTWVLVVADILVHRVICKFILCYPPVWLNVLEILSCQVMQKLNSIIFATKNKRRQITDVTSKHPLNIALLCSPACIMQWKVRSFFFFCSHLVWSIWLWWAITFPLYSQTPIPISLEFTLTLINSAWSYVLLSSFQLFGFETLACYRLFQVYTQNYACFSSKLFTN